MRNNRRFSNSQISQNQYIIIYVEDENTQHRLSMELGEIFENIQVKYFSKYKEAIVFVQNQKRLINQIPIIISDYKTQEISGIEFLNEINAINTKSNKILLVDDYEHIEIQEANENFRLFRYIIKPWQKLDLIITLREASHSFFCESSRENLMQELELKKLEFIVEHENILQKDKITTAFLANVSHKVRSPLNGIIGFAELLSMPDIDKNTITTYVNHIESSAKNLLQTLNEVLDISMLESGQVSLLSKEFFLNDLLIEIETNYKNEALNKGINFKIDKGLLKHNNRIESDRLRLKQLLTYILDNAIQNTKTGEVELGYLANTNNHTFYIKDSGVGIGDLSSLDIDAVIEFINSKNKNKGFGLSICKDLIKLLGGKIIFDSKTNQYTHVFINIPLLSNNQVEHLKPTDYENIFWGGDKKALLIDQDANHLIQLKQNLIKIGVISQCIQNSKDMELINSYNDFDIVIIDMHLKKLDAVDIIKNIKLVEHNIPILALTSYSMVEDKIKSVEAGAVEFICKPIEFNELLKVIDKYLRKTII